MILASGLGFGGAETVIRHMAQAIDRDRFNLTLGCVKTLGPVGRELADAGADIVCLTDPDRKGVDYFTWLTLRRIVRAKGIQLVHTHTTDGLADAAVCKLTMPSLKVVHTFHFGNYPHVGTNNLRLEKLASKMADRLIAVGEVQRGQIRNVFGFNDARLGMIWNGVLPAVPAAGQPFRELIGAGNRVVVGTVATLTEQKGLRDFLAVADSLRDLSSRVCFVIAGDGHLREELETIRREKGLEDMVTLAGWVPDAATVALPAFDIFFQSSLWEAMSVAILEAMAAGKPIVATTVGENAGVLRDGVDGLLVEPRDVPGMAAAIRSLVEDPARRQQFGDSARARVASTFTVDQMARNYERLFLETIAS
jgi:glycosyltransferase involved in cell wall biosynthesis